MEFNIIPDDEALSQCAGCHVAINEETEILDIGIALKSNVDLSKYESHCIEIELDAQDKPVYMLVTSKRSDAKLAGIDGLFLLCSEVCAEKFKSTLETEMAKGQFIQTIKT